VRILSFAIRFVLTIAVGAAALAGSIALLAPAGRSLDQTITPLGELDLHINTPASRSLVYDKYGGVMGSFATEDRSPVKLSQVPQVLIDAVLSIEDRKFYEHHGVDWSGTARALFKNVDVGGISQGGSTITQQLVKNTLSTNRKRDLMTKAREAVLAIRLEHELTKNQILEDYLNLVYFGNGAYGVQAAAERYFNVPLQKVGLAESALLAGLIQAPEALNPIKRPDLAARRRGEVLDAMVSNGKIAAAQAKFAKSVPLPTHLYYPVTRPLDYYIDEVKNVLLNNDPNVPGDPAEALGDTQQKRASELKSGGLKIYTEYDPYAQLIAQKAVNDILPKSQFTASLVVIDNQDGGVRAIANGRTFQQMQFDPATEGLGRQAGSSFKTFTLAAALSHGYSPNDTIDASDVRNYDNGKSLSSDCHGGTPDLGHAIAKSDNCAFVHLEMSLGPGNHGRDGVKQVIATAKAMGIDSASKFDPTALSTTLGTQGVHPLEMAQAYSVLPNDGVLKRARFVTKIVGPDGNVIYQNTDTGHRVLDPNVARAEISLLKDVVKFGTASGTLSGFPRPIAGKTGTTDNNVDAWFVGFTPQYTAAVWMGNPDGEEPMVGLPGGAVQGATYPARIWRQFMLDATANLPPLDFLPYDPSYFPRPTYINEFGRRVGSYCCGSNNLPQPVIPLTPSTTPITTPPTTAQNTPAPAKKKHHGSPITVPTGP